MSVCATCLKPGLPADGQHDCPGLGEIGVSRERGRGVVVDHAPQRALIGLRIIRDLAWPANIAGVGDPDLVNIADQVLYRVVDYDAGSAALVVELVEDWRPPATPRPAPCGAVHPVDPSAPCDKPGGHDDGEHSGETNYLYRLNWPAEPADATVCTPIPAETLMQMSEVPAELLTEQQLGRAENALERLRLAREALIRDGYFTADEVGPDIAPRIVEWLSHHRQELEQARADARALGASVQEWHDTAVRHQRWGQRRWNAWKSARARAQRVKAELDRLTAGEEPGWDPLVVPTPGQWIARWNRANAAERLDVAKRVIGYTATAGECFEMNHVRRLEEDRRAWVKLARVEDVVAEMEQITGARHWARILRKAVDGEREAPPDQLATALREVLAAFATVTSPTSGMPMGYQAPPIHPDDMTRWRAALDPGKEQQ